MSDLTSVFLIGRLTRDCELKATAGGLAVCTFSMACGRKVKDEDTVSYFDIVCFGKLGEVLNKYLVKGKQVAVLGDLKQDRWEKDGVKHSRVSIIANSIQLLGGEGKKEAAEPAHTFAPAGDYGQMGPDKGKPFTDDIPF